MLNGNQWHQLHSDFLSDIQVLMARTDECLIHLDLIRDDQDAIECLLGTLQQIAGQADTAGVSPIAAFARQLRYLLYFTHIAGRLRPEVFLCLKQCLSLLAWQIELVDPFNGQLLLDDSEQRQLLEQFGFCSGVGNPDADPVDTAQWPAPAPAVQTDTAPGDQTDRPAAL